MGIPLALFFKSYAQMRHMSSMFSIRPAMMSLLHMVYMMTEYGGSVRFGMCTQNSPACEFLAGFCSVLTIVRFNRIGVSY